MGKRNRRKMNKFICVFILKFFIIQSFIMSAQEGLSPIYYNPNIKPNPFHNVKSLKSAHLKSASNNFPFFDDFAGSKTLDTSLWLKSTVDIADSAGNQINQNYAVFDNKNGKYFDTAKIIGDTLTSQPIDLSNASAADNIYLSYYYKNRTVDNASNGLALFFVEFYSPQKNKWDTVSAHNNNILLGKYSFDSIPVKDSIYFGSNFQFRFVLYDSLKVNSYTNKNNSIVLDTVNQIWNLDYVYLNKRNSKFKADTSSGGLCAHSYMALPFFDDFSDSIGYVKKRFWTDNDVYVNDHYSDNPISVGVATFDALDSRGYLYPQALKSYEFSADTLTSVRLPFGLYTNDSIYLSFFYEPGGLGELPDKTDSLILEFYNPSAQVWNWIWSVSGDSSRVFKLAMIPIKKSIYLDYGFRFRFRNLASINIPNVDFGRNGNGDIWNLDYVKIDNKEYVRFNDSISSFKLYPYRTWDDTVFYDLAFIRPIQSPLVNFTSIPQAHFRLPSTYENEMSGKITLYVRNNDTVPWGVERSYTIKDVYDTLTYPFAGSKAISAPRNSIVSFSDNLVDNPLLSENQDSALFIITATLDSTLKIEPHSNDTIRFYQWFRNYYSYDDGSAEYGYGIAGGKSKDAKIALRFNTYMEDTLRAVDIYFNPTLNKENTDGSYVDTTFELMVWSVKGSTPDTLLYNSKDTSYAPYIGFHRYYLKPAIAVPKHYFIGTKQNDNYFLNIGFDVSKDNSKYLYNNTEGIDSAYAWMPSSMSGTLMMRPIVGSLKDALASVKTTSTIEEKIQIYPNPTSGLVNIVVPGNTANNRIMVFDLTGKMLINQELTNSTVNISDFRSGLYLLRVISGNGNIYNSKIIKYSN